MFKTKIFVNCLKKYIFTDKKLQNVNLNVKFLHKNKLPPSNVFNGGNPIKR